MSLHIGRRLALPRIKRHHIRYSLAALLIAFSSLLSLPALQAHADVPQYDQESPGFGDRHVVGGWYQDFTVDASGNLFTTGGNGTLNQGFINKFAPDGSFIKSFYVPDFNVATQTQYRRMAVDTSGNLFVIDEQSHTIHVFSNDGVYQRAIAGIPASADIAFDHLDNYYLTDSANQRVQKFSHDGTLLYTIGGPSAGSGDGQFNSPANVAVDSQNNLVVSDGGNHRIQMFTSSGSFLRKFGQTTTGLYCPPQPSLDGLAGLAVDSSDNIYVTTHNMWCANNVQKFSNTGAYIATQVRSTSVNYLRAAPGNIIYNLASETNPSGGNAATVIASYDTSGNLINSKVVGGIDKLIRPLASVQDSAGNTYVADVMNAVVRKYDSNHVFVQNIGGYGNGDGQFINIGGLTIDKNDVLYVGDYGRSNVQEFTTSGTFLRKFGSNGYGDGKFQFLGKMAARPDGTIAVLDGAGNIQFFNPDGTFVGKITASGLSSYAIKSDGTVSVFWKNTSYGSTQYYIQNYDSTNTLVGTPANVYFYDSATNSAFMPYADIAYDRFDNLYTLGNDNRNPQSINAVARLNLTNPDLPSYTVIIPTVYDLTASLYFTASNQLLITSGNNDYVYQYNVASLLKAPNAPTNLTTTATHGQLSLNWHAPAAGPAPLKYLIEYRPHAAGTWLRREATAATSSALTGLLDDDYDVRVSAMNEAGFSPVTEQDNVHVSADYSYHQRLTSPNDGEIRGISFGPDGRRYDVDAWNDVINIYDANGTFIKSFGSGGSDPGQLDNPRQPAIANNKLYVPDYYNQRVNIYDLDGNFLSSFGSQGTGDGQMQYPSQVYADPDGSIYVVSEYYNIQKYTADGTFIERAFTDVAYPVSMMRDASGNYYVSLEPEDNSGAVVYKYDSAGNLVLQLGTYGNGIGQMYEAPGSGLAVNGIGQLVVNDAYNERISFYDSTSGAFLYSVGRGPGNTGEYLTFDDPYTMAQAPNGDLYIPNSYSPYTQILRPTFSSGGGTPTQTAPSSPRSVTATSPSAGTITASWQAPSSNGGSSLTNYLLEYKPSTGTTWSQVDLPASATGHSLTSVPAGDYDIQVHAINAIGISAPSPITTVTVAGTSSTPPSPVAPPATTQPSTPAPTPTVVTAPSSPYVAPPAGTSSRQPDKVIAATDSTTSHEVPTQSTPPTLHTQQDKTKPGTVSITWQPPAGETPTRYVIEYRDATVPPSDTTTPWKQVATAQSSDRSSTFTLPAGNYTVRVAAVYPGETPRIILGVAHITIPAPVPLPAANATKPSVGPVVAICVGLVTIALFILIFFGWKRRRRNQAAEAARHAQLPPRWR